MILGSVDICEVPAAYLGVRSYLRSACCLSKYQNLHGANKFHAIFSYFLLFSISNLGLPRGVGCKRTTVLHNQMHNLVLHYSLRESLGAPAPESCLRYAKDMQNYVKIKTSHTILGR